MFLVDLKIIYEVDQFIADSEKCCKNNARKYGDCVEYVAELFGF